MSDPQKTSPLPRFVDPRKLAAQNAHLHGLVPTAEMARLRSAVVAVVENAEAELEFYRDEAHRSLVKGAFSLSVDCQCQRCLQPVTQHLQGTLQLGIVWDEDRAAALPKEADAWLVSEESADVYELLEDEILLALPIVAYHDEGQCQGRGNYSTGEFVEARKNPFDILAQLKK